MYRTGDTYAIFSTTRFTWADGLFGVFHGFLGAALTVSGGAAAVREPCGAGGAAVGAQEGDWGRRLLTLQGGATGWEMAQEGDVECLWTSQGGWGAGAAGDVEPAQDVEPAEDVEPTEDVEPAEDVEVPCLWITPQGGRDAMGPRNHTRLYWKMDRTYKCL